MDRLCFLIQNFLLFLVLKFFDNQSTRTVLIFHPIESTPKPFPNPHWHCLHSGEIRFRPNTTRARSSNKANPKPQRSLGENGKSNLLWNRHQSLGASPLEYFKRQASRFHGGTLKPCDCGDNCKGFNGDSSDTVTR